MHEIVRINQDNQGFFQKGFANIYINIFADFPYFENFTEDEAVAVYRRLSYSDSIFLLVLKNKEVIGFSGGMPLEKASKNVQNNLLNVFEIKKCLYNAELGIIPESRKKGLGTKIAKMQIDIAREEGYQYICLRTIKGKSMSEAIYRRLGFNILDSVEMNVVQNRTKEDVNLQDTRIFMFKNINQ